MDSYPKNLVDQYLKASSKLKKFERVVFKRFGPNVGEVLEDFARLVLKFKEAGIYPYAAMCQLGVAKCEMFMGNALGEYQAFLKAARLFLRSHEEMESLLLRSNRGEYREAALHCFTQALERCPDESVIKAAIIREMKPLQPHYEGTSSFASPAHRIYELELSAESCLRRRDYLGALQQLDDICDNIYERKRQSLYVEVLARVELSRVLLLVALSLPPARQTPAHIKLIQYYYEMANFEDVDKVSESSPSGSNNSWQPGSHLPLAQKYLLAEVVLSWHLNKPSDLKVALQEFSHECNALTETQRFLIANILESVNQRC